MNGAENPSLWRDLLAPPWRRYRFVTHLMPAGAIAAIRDATEPRRLFRMPFGETRTFEGEVGDQSFRISRIIRYRNSLRPLIIGRVEADPEGTRIEIVMRPEWFAMVSIVLILAVAMTIVVLAEASLGAITAHHARLGLIACVITFTYLMISVPFGLEARWSREILRAMLAAEVGTPATESKVDMRGRPQPIPIRTPYVSAEQWRRQRLVHRIFIACFVAVFFISVGAFAVFSIVWRSAAKHPEGRRTAALVNHGQTAYVTPQEKFVVDLLETLMLAGIVSVMAGGLIIDRWMGVPLFSNPPRPPHVGS